MLNNITNFFNLIKTGKVKTQLDGTDLLPIGTRDTRFTGQYQPTMIKYSDLVAGLVGGSNGQVLFNDNDTIAGASNLYWDKINQRVGIGTSTPAHLLDVNGTARITSLITTELVSTSPNQIINIKNSGGTIAGRIFPDGSILRFASSNSLLALSIFANANVGIGQATDDGFRLDVNGTARVQNTTTITKGAANYITLEPSANATSPFLDMFFSGQVSTRISLGTTSSTRVFLFRDLGTALGMGIDCGAIFSNSNAILIGGAEQKVQIAGTTNNYLQFTQAGTANRGTIGYAAGQSYMQIRVNGATDLATGTLSTAFFSTGNVGINTTTDAGFKLDVNGTARVSGVTTVSISGSASSVILGNATANADRIIDATGYVGNRAAYRFNNINGGTAEFGANNLTYNNRLTCGTQGNIGLLIIGATGTAAAGSSVLEMQSTTQGFLPPRMTTTEKNAIATPAAGLMVYDNTLNRPCFYNGTSWITL